MAPNYTTALLKQNLDDVAPPATLPSGTAYPGTITKYEFRKYKAKGSEGAESNILTYSVRFNDWSPEVPEGERLDSKGHPIDITQKTSRMDYFIDSESGAYALAQLLKALGLKGDLESAIPMAVGAQVLCKGEQKLIEKDNSIVFNLRTLNAA